MENDKLKIFFDCEFTGLHQGTTLISIGFISEFGERFYAELTDYDSSQINDWIRKHVIANLKFKKPFETQRDIDEYKLLGSQSDVKIELEHWFKSTLKEHSRKQVEIWSDCLAYDWMIFCQLWDGALNIPKEVYYIPMDISTLFRIKNIDPDINREKFAEIDDSNAEKHNSLWDAEVIRSCYGKLTGEEIRDLPEEKKKDESNAEVNTEKRELQKSAKKEDEETKGEDEADQKEGQEEYAEVKPSGNNDGREITAEEVLEKFNSFVLRKPFIYLVGGLANNGKTKGDIDILIKAGPDELPESFTTPLEFRILRLFNESDRERVHFLYDKYSGPFTNHYELADLKVERRDTFEKIEMSKQKEMDKDSNLGHGEGHKISSFSGDSLIEEIEKSFQEEEFPEEFIEKVRFHIEVQKAEFRLAGKAGVEANKEARRSMKENKVVLFRRFYPQKTSVSALMAYRKQETYSVNQTLDYLQKLFERGIR